jgi:hypothetical protein
VPEHAYFTAHEYMSERFDTAGRSMGDVATLIAPRPLLIETGTRNPLNGQSGLANVLAQMDITRRAYGLLGARERWHTTFSRASTVGTD